MREGLQAQGSTGTPPLSSLTHSPICATMTPTMMPTTAGFSLSSVVDHLSCVRAEAGAGVCVWEIGICWSEGVGLD